jgi:hypothetical protein
VCRVSVSLCCPAGNTCCLRYDGMSDCIPNDLGSYNATCCEDGRTGCAVGYHCRPNETCEAGEGLNDPLVQIFPPYKLGTTDKLRQVYGFPVTKDAKLPYYSSLGDISEGVRETRKVTRVIVVVHGAGRNADDSFCSEWPSWNNNQIWTQIPSWSLRLAFRSRQIRILTCQEAEYQSNGWTTDRVRGGTVAMPSIPNMQGTLVRTMPWTRLRASSLTAHDSQISNTLL